MAKKKTPSSDRLLNDLQQQQASSSPKKPSPSSAQSKLDLSSHSSPSLKSSSQQNKNKKGSSPSNGTFSRIFFSLKHFDASISQRIFLLGGHTEGSIRSFLKSLEYFGHEVPSIILLILIAILCRHHSFLFQMHLNLLFGVIMDLAFVGIWKAVFRRPRPPYTADDMIPTGSVDMFSCPSGHATRSAFVSSFLIDEVVRPWQLASISQLGPAYHTHANILFYWIFNPYLALIWMVSIGGSRVMLGRHYVSDIIVGWILGSLHWVLLHKILWMPSWMTDWVRESLITIILS
jgi:membrane-associated phospholipid phosphatase